MNRASPLKLRRVKYNNLIRYPIIGDGSCFFHAILRSHNERYIKASTRLRKQLAKQFREDLATFLKKVDSRTGRPYYHSLARGGLHNFSKSYPPASLKNMVKELKSSSPVDNIYHELVSDYLSKDIYLLDYTKGDVYLTSSDHDLLFKGRKSMILLVRPGHYELVGVMEKRRPKTLFSHNHPLIRMIRERLHQLAPNRTPAPEYGVCHHRLRKKRRVEDEYCTRKDSH